ncbi:DMT family transporter [Inquilinus sp. Marseille-Q2685]|uniref:DMT family transporter n=1 Tax=Inquilinus sp. Marseille-Q2685 TaxID=2866581 RepID=UPI001CE41283|nr:DMT family transporter [Inquilinus sp. Marseille-Q2685]
MSIAKPAAPPPMGIADWLLLIALSLVWGGSFFFSKVAVAELPPLTIVLVRVGLAAIALLPVLRLAGLSMPRDRRIWMAFFGMGVLNNLIPFCLIVWGQTRIGSGLAAILNATTPLFTVLVAHVLTVDEKLTPKRLSGVLLGLAGVVVLIGPQVLGGLGGEVTAQLAILGAALSYAFAGIFGRRFRGLPPMVTATGQVGATSLMMLPIVCLVDRPWTLPMPSGATLLSLGGLALLSTSLAYVLYFKLLARVGATNTVLVTLLIPPSAMLLGHLVLGEVLAGRAWAGMALIGLGLIALDGRLFARVWRVIDRSPGRTASS